MVYECYTRILVGVPLEVAALDEIVAGFHASLGLGAEATEHDVLVALRETSPRHERNISDRLRFERAFEAWVDARWDVDCAIAGISAGGLDAKRCTVWVGVRIEQFEHSARVEAPVPFVRPRVLRKGDLSVGSELARTLGPEARKPLEHAGRMYSRARLSIEGDAIARTRKLPGRRRQDIAWVMLRWLVPLTTSR
jgi:hypothetical protein